MAPRRRCPTCGSKQWHKEPSSGLIACSEGHVLQNYRSETTEITEVGPHAMKKRTLKSGKKKKEDTSKADPKLYHGARGRYHYFLCLQLILRKQVAALVKLWNLPPEFEIICRDIWALHLSLLSNPPPAEPYYHAQEMRGEGALGEGESAKEIKTKLESSTARELDGSEGSATEGEQSIKPRGKETDDADDDDEDDGDSELEALLRADSEISSTSSSEGEDHAPSSKPHKKVKRKGHSIYDSPVSTIGVLVVACWTLRIPVMLRDLTRLIESYKLPYLDPTIRILPPSMVQHLTKHNVQALSPRHAPGTMLIHTAASRIAKRLHGTYGIVTGECNAASLLWRLTKEMAGSPTVYKLAKRTASVLSIRLTLDSRLSPEGEGQRVRHGYDMGPPEVALVACIIIVLKLVYGLDGKARVPRSAEDIGWAMAEYGEYLAEMKKMEEEDLERKETRFGAKSNLPVGDMDEIELDRYIEFCEEALLGYARGKNGGPDRYFAVVGMEGQREEEGPGSGDRRRLRGRRAEGGLRAGSEYEVWDAGTSGGVVVVRGARVAGVAAEEMGRVAGRYEERLVQWIAGRKRRGRGRRE